MCSYESDIGGTQRRETIFREEKKEQITELRERIRHQEDHAKEITFTNLQQQLTIQQQTQEIENLMKKMGMIDGDNIRLKKLHDDKMKNLEKKLNSCMPLFVIWNKKKIQWNKFKRKRSNN